MSSLFRIWNATKYIGAETKINMYKAFIIPVLTYNIAAIGTSDAKLERLEVAHRRFLRRVLRIFFPNRISNSKLYETSKCPMIKSIATKARWKLFGRLLRQRLNAPANLVMHAYFSSPSGKRKGGRPLARDLREVHKNLKNGQHLQDLRSIAMNRRAWKRLADIITTERNRTYKQDLERATARARARKRAREDLIITIPRSLWETMQQRQDDIEDPPRRKRIRLILPPDANAGNTEPNAVSDMDTGQMNPFLHTA
jgi:hypothetical protein